MPLDLRGSEKISRQRTSRDIELRSEGPCRYPDQNSNSTQISRLNTSPQYAGSYNQPFPTVYSNPYSVSSGHSPPQYGQQQPASLSGHPVQRTQVDTTPYSYSSYFPPSPSTAAHKPYPSHLSSTPPYYIAGQSSGQYNDLERNAPNQLSLTQKTRDSSNIPQAHYRPGDTVYSTSGDGPFTIESQSFISGNWKYRGRREGDDPDRNQTLYEFPEDQVIRPRFRVGDRVEFPRTNTVYEVVDRRIDRNSRRFQYLLRSPAVNSQQWWHTDLGGSEGLRRAR